MKVIYTDKAKQRGEEYPLLQQASQRLEEIVGPSADSVTAEWDRTEDGRGRMLYTLRISDWTGSATAALAPDELRSTVNLRHRLLQLWGDLLQIRNQYQLQKLMAPGD